MKVDGRGRVVVFWMWSWIMRNGKKIRLRLWLVFGLLFILIWWIWSWVPFVNHEEIDLNGGGKNSLRILLITDLHSCRYGKGQKRLLKMIDKSQPDLVMLGGDFFDDKLKDTNAMIVAEHVSKMCPCFYVSGNHEFWSGRAEEMKQNLRRLGITVLEGDCATVEAGGRMIDVCGVDDPVGVGKIGWAAQLEDAYAKTDGSHLRILLTHRPELVFEYEKYDFNLIMAGQAHAGQIRIPFLNRGLYAPNQGLFARYVNGAYRLSNGGILYVSRGLARESTPGPRFFNHPELVVLDCR